MITEKRLHELRGEGQKLGVNDIWKEAQAAVNKESPLLENAIIKQDVLEYLALELLSAEEVFVKYFPERMQKIESRLTRPEKLELLRAEARMAQAPGFADFGIKFVATCPWNIEHNESYKYVFEAFVHKLRYYDKKFELFLKHGLMHKDLAKILNDCELKPEQIKHYRALGAPTFAEACANAVHQRELNKNKKELYASSKAVPGDPDKGNLIQGQTRQNTPT